MGAALAPHRIFAHEMPSPPGGDGCLPGLNFEEIAHSYDDTHHVARGYNADVLIRWGDPVTKDAPRFDPNQQSAQSQAEQFGYNNDFIGFVPLPLGSDSSDHGLLCVNHEYTSTSLMLPGFKDDWQAFQFVNKEEIATEMAAHGHSVVEIRKISGQWQVVAGSAYNRRITLTTPMEITGPAAGHRRLQTQADPTGRRVLGTLYNCAGGITPWGTVLMAEEGISDYFGGDLAALEAEAARELLNYQSHAAKYNNFSKEDSLPYSWHRHIDRFDINKEPFEINRFGWMVEFDPYNPSSTPMKRTALGRFAHEGATIVSAAGKPVIAYMGDDNEFECIYKFVSKKPYLPADRNHNLTLLEEGDLFVAKIDADGGGQWLKLTFENQFENTPASHLTSQVDVLIEVRNAARALGATPMDRPEDIETNPVTGRTYVMLTNNSDREESQTDPANPRAFNAWGQILEIIPPGVDGERDHWADEFTWDMFLLAGNPSHPDPQKRGRYNPDITKHGWFCCPDNLCFDPSGRMWIATDGGSSNKLPDGTPDPIHDGLWACETTGDDRALTKHFFGCPRGAEAAGPCFTPDGETLFVAVQHPGAGNDSNYATPSTRWPDFSADMPPRPSVMVITKKENGKIGSG